MAVLISRTSKTSSQWAGKLPSTSLVCALRDQMLDFLVRDLAHAPPKGLPMSGPQLKMMSLPVFGNLYRLFLTKLDPVAYARTIGVTVGKDCRLINVSFSTEPYLITLGDHVSATNTRFETHDGGVWVLRGERPGIDIIRPVTVGNNVYFGYGCIVMPGVTIGDNVIIGAGSIVTKDIPSGSVAVGVPARVIKSIDDYRRKTFAEGNDTKQFNSEEKRSWYLKKYHK